MDHPDLPREPTRSERRTLDRQGWWAWLTCRDDAMADAIEEYLEGLPPWLDSLPWLGIGAAAGVLLGLPLALPTALRGLPPMATAMQAVCLASFVAFALAAREAWTEEARHFVSRVAVTLLHLPFLYACQWAILLLLPTMSGWTRQTGLWLWIGFPVLTAAASRITTPRLLTQPDFDGSWPSLAGLPSLAFRLMALLAFGGAAMASSLPSWLKPVLGAIAAGAFVTTRSQERLAASLADRLRWWHPRRREWPVRRRPEPYAFEAALLAVDSSPAARALAADYADQRDYSAQELDQAMRRLGLGAPKDRRRVHAAAMCALELWANPASGRDASYRGFARLDAVAKRHGESLDDAFWQRLAAVCRGTERAAAACRAVLGWRAALGWDATRTWKRLAALGWPEVAVAERDVLEGALQLLGELDDPYRVHDALSELELAAGGPLPAGTRAVAAGLLEALAPAGERPRPNSHAAYPLELRRLAWRAAEGVEATAWYAAAARFEELPDSRQDELVPPAVYFGWWRLVLTAVNDAEELARQTERYRQSAKRVASRQGEEPTPSPRPRQERRV